MATEDRDKLLCQEAVGHGFLAQDELDARVLRHRGDCGAVWLGILAAHRLSAEQVEIVEDAVRARLRAALIEQAPTMAELRVEAPKATTAQTTLAGPATGSLTRTLQSEGVEEASPTDARVTEESEGRYISAADDGSDLEIGQGGIGRVLVVRDLHLGRRIAMKELLRDAARRADPDSPGLEGRPTVEDMTVARFLREARVTGSLEHPNIVPVYELGMRRDGTLYYTMRHVRGRTLTDALSRCASLGERLQLLTHFGSLCHAIAYAHSRGVLHRDIKPDNVMIGEFGETVVLDWGLAKVRGSHDVRGSELEHDARRLRDVAAGLTVQGSLMGTPSYMSPEQAAGSIDELDERTDVWALGVVLYRILTGELPFGGTSVAEVVGRVRAAQFTPPRELDDRIPADLASVCVKALQLAPDARYASAKELAREIDAYQTGEKVAAHEYTSTEHLRRFASKNRPLLVALTVTLGAILAALAMTSWFYTREKAARITAQVAAQREQQALEKERRERLLADYHLAQSFGEKAARLAREKSTLAARLYAAASLVHNPAAEGGPSYDATFAASTPQSLVLRLGAASRIWQSAATHAVLFDRTLKAEEKLFTVAFSPDGKTVAAAGDAGRLRLWDAPTGTALAPLSGHTGRINAIAFSADGNRLGSCAESGEVRLADVRTGALIGSLKLEGGAALDLAFSPTAPLLAVASHDGTIEVWSSDGARRTTVLRGHRASVHALSFSGDGRLLASASRDKTVRIWDLAAGSLRRTLEGHSAVVHGVAMSQDGASVASASYDKTIRVWDVDTGALRFVGGGFDDEVLSVTFSPDATQVSSASWDRSIRIWDARSGTLLEKLYGHGAAAWDVAYSPDGSRLASAGEDKRVRLWRMAPVRPVLSGDGQGYVWSARFLPDGHSVIVAGADGTIRVWDTDSGKVRARLRGHTDLVADLALSRDGKTLASAGYDRTARIWDVTTARERHALRGHEGFVRSVALSPDAALVASGSHDGRVILWDVATGQSRLTIDPHAGPVRQVAFSPDGRWVAVASNDGSAGLWDSATGSESVRLRAGGDNASALAFTRDGTCLSTAASDGTVILWDLASRQPSRPMKWHDQSVYSIRFSPDERRMATAGDDRTVGLWNVGAPTPFLLIEASQSVMVAEYSPDGRTLAYSDGTSLRLVLSDVDTLGQTPGQQLDAARSAAGMDLDGFEVRLAD